MSTRCNWHLDELLADGDADLFDDDEPARVEDVGKPIDLDGDTARLQRRLTELVRAEGQLWNRGVTCAIRDRKDTCCSACPVAQAGGERSELCRVGREQERVLTTLAAVRDASQAP